VELLRQLRSQNGGGLVVRVESVGTQHERPTEDPSCHLVAESVTACGSISLFQWRVVAVVVAAAMVMASATFATAAVPKSIIS
jgi:hypothetical protein